MTRLRLLRSVARLPLAAVLLGLGACSAVQDTRDFFFGPPDDQPGGSMQRISGFIGGVVADEPNAAVVGREVLATGGNAADAATAMGFALAATYPSRASLGGGGACLVYRPSVDGPGAGRPEAILFVPPAASPAPAGMRADRPAAVPTLARGLFVLAARYGNRPIERLITPAEQGARFGFPISRALADDIAAVGPALLADPAARAVFAPNGHALAAGETLTQPDLAGTLSQLRVAGVGELYQGSLGRRFVAASAQAGGPVSEADLRAAVPRIAPPIVLADRNDLVAFLPPPADGGLAAAAAFRVLQQNATDSAAAANRAAAVVALSRRQGGDPQALLNTEAPPATLPTLPASTSFLAYDKDGGAVACAVTDNNLFGTGRIAPGTGVILAASPAAAPPPLLAAAVAWNEHMAKFRAAAASSGQNGAGLGLAVAMLNALRGGTAMPAPVPEPGRANVVSCPQYAPGGGNSCDAANDKRGAGISLGNE